MSEVNIEKIELNEVSRVYMFPGDQELKIEGAKVCYIDANGTHRLQNEKGEIYIVPYRWLGFKVQEKDRVDTEIKKEPIGKLYDEMKLENKDIIPNPNSDCE